MRSAQTSLPPMVEGSVRGALRLSLGAPRWAEGAPRHLRQHALGIVARVAWWGDASGGDLLPLPPPAAAAACLLFQLRTGPKYLTRYLHDMGAITITIEAEPSSGGGSSGPAEAAAAQPLAATTVALLALDVQAPISGTYPLQLLTEADSAGASSSDAGGGNDSAATVVGSLEVRLELDYSSDSGAAALVSSFELNEHLASSTAGALEDAGAAESDRAGGDGVSGGSSACAVAAGAEPSGLCEQLLAALQNRELAAAAVQRLERNEAAADEQHVLDGLQLQLCTATCRLLPLLLSSASQPQLQYVAAMLQPFGGCSCSAGCEDSEGEPPTAISLEQLAAAAAECAAVEHELASLPAADALQGLRQAAAALASRSLDLAVAFAAADQQQLPLGQLGTQLQRLYPGATSEEARRLLAVVAGCGRSCGAVTLPAIRAALARVQEAQQFPTIEELARQQAAGEVRRAKEAAAAAVEAVEQQRAAAAAAARAPPSQRKQAVVGKLKHSLQERRRSSTSGSSVPAEAQVAPPPADQLAQQPAVVQLPAVVLGIPVLPPPPPAAQLLPSLPAQPAATLATPASPGSADDGSGRPAAAAAAGPQTLGALGMLAVQRPQPELEEEEEQAQQAQQQQQQQQQLDVGQAQPPPQQQQPQPYDALLQLIQQAEALKAAMHEAGSCHSGTSTATSARSQLWEAAAAAATAPRLPNLLLPLATTGGGIPAGAAEAVAGSTGLSAATAALLAASQALRLDCEQLPPPAASVAAQAVPAAAGPVVMLDSAAVAAGDSDAESDAEDALLDQLFFQRTQQRAAAAGPAGAAGAADDPSAQPAAKQPEPAAQLVLRVQLGPPKLAGPSERSSSVRCVIKPLQTGGAARHLSVPVAPATGAAPTAVELPVHRGPGSDSHLPLLPPYLFLEFWRHSGDLLGVARVPLLQPPAAACSGAAQEGFPAAVVAEGWHPISDILEGRDAGSIHMAAVLQESGAAPLAASVRHCFSVGIRSAHRLPSAAAYAGAALRAPDARVLCYSFPGEPDALQTGEVPCCSSPSFDASANHEIVLPAGHSILPLLQDGLLHFELFDCWADQQQRQQHGWALLHLRELASLAAEAESSSGGGTVREASRTLLLPLCTEYESAGEAAGAAGAGEAAARGPSLKIKLSYKAQLCTTEAAQAAAAPSVAAPAEDEALACSSPAPPVRPAGGKPAAGANGRRRSSDSDRENTLLLANRSTSSDRQAQHAAQGRPAAGTPSVAAGAQPAARSIPAEPFVPATLVVEIVRACGLGAAVREAAAAAGGGAGTSLGRAAVVGPHAFVRLALFPQSDAALQSEAPPLQTAFVPQSFCPAWRSVHSYPLQLTGGMVQALAAQSMRVEVWHRCPRAASGSGREAREVLLGAGAVPLVDVLCKPQGLRCWVPLTPGSDSSSHAGVAGAVQVAARLTSLGRLSSGCAESKPLLLRCAEAAALVPAALRPRLLAPPGAGFTGQHAVLAVHLDSLVPPSSSSSLGSGRPKADRFFCRYSLPGADGSSTATASRVLACVGGGAPAGPPRKGGGRGGSSSSAAADQLRRWAVKLTHSGFFEVTGDASLAAALLQGPLLVHVYKQPAGAATEGGRSAVLVGTAEVDLSPLLWASGGGSSGSVDEAAGSRLRTISGTYPLLEGAAAAQGGASLAARVQLQLQPEAGAAQQAATAAAAGAHTAALERQQAARVQPGQASLCSVASSQQQLTQQQGHSTPSSSDSEDDEAHEELLQRCQRLAATLRSVCPAPDAAHAPEGCTTEAAGEGGSQAAGEQPAAGSGPDQQAAEQAAAQGTHAAAGSAGTSGVSGGQQTGAPAPPGSSSPSEPGVRQDLPERADAPDELCKLLLQIDSALHLPTEAPVGSSGGAGSDGYSAFVSAAWGPHQQSTAAVPVHAVAAAELGGTAVWHAELELPAAAAAWESQSSSSMPHRSGTNLVLNVWVAPGAAGSMRGGGSGQPASSADSLLGCCVLDLRALPALQQVAGYWHIVDPQQQQQGQLKASVRASRALLDALQQQRGRPGHADATGAAGRPAAPAAAAGAAAGGSPHRPEQQQVQQPAAGAAQEEGHSDQLDSAGGDLAQQVQAQLQELQVLSQRLAGQPRALAAAVAPVSAAGPDADDDAVAAMLAAAGPLQAGADVVKPFDALPASDEEWDSCVLPVDPHQQGRFAWSGSDSDDGMGLLGIAVDGAISGEVTEEEEEEGRPRGPMRLLAEDWMFAISRAGVQEEAEQLAAQHAAGQLGQLEQQQQAGQAGQLRPLVRFRNVIPGGALSGAAGREPTAPATHVEELAGQQRREQEEEPAARTLPQCGGAAEAAAAAAQGPALHQFGAMPAAVPAQQAPVQLQQPLPRQQQLAGGLQPGWQFDIRRDATLPAAGAAAGSERLACSSQHSSAAAAATPASVGLDQFGARQASHTTAASPASAATPASLLAQQRAELQQRSQEAQQRSQEVRSPAAAATIDEVLAQLRGGGRGAAATGGRRHSRR